MQIIGITSPDCWDGEAPIITSLLKNTLDIVHIRKLDVDTEKVETLISLIPSEYHARLVLHNHHELASQFAFKAIHLNTNKPLPPADYKGALTRSCHTIAELKDITPYEYVFLSPIFESISKQGYTSGFTAEVLQNASQEGLINSKVVALGGITPSHFAKLQAYGFGGAAMMGYLWNTIRK